MKKEYFNLRDSELLAVLEEARAISNQPELTKRDEARINVLLAKASALKTAAVAPDKTLRWFKALAKGDSAALAEYRTNTDMLAGTQSITYTAGSQGGYLVPNEFYDDLVLAMAQYDPLLDSDVVSLIESKTFALRPYQIPGWDMTTFTATKVAEGAQQGPGAPPNSTQAQLKSWTYRASLDASIEFEEDDFQNFLNQFERALSIGFARGIGVDLAVGNGTSAPQGILTGAVNSGVTTANAGKLVLDDFTDIFFALNRIHRASPKCGWVIADETYQLVRQATDGNGRPLISIKKDKEVILGKPVYVSPSIPYAAGSTGIVFGDLSQYFVRLSGLSLVRATQLPGQIEYGKALFTGRMRADAKVVDPSAGSVPPIVYATLHS
jgi:HK97 family phage major capsid protein